METDTVPDDFAVDVPVSDEPIVPPDFQPSEPAGLPDSEIDIPIDGTGASVTEGSSGKPSLTLL